MNDKTLLDWNNADQYLKERIFDVAKVTDLLKKTVKGQFVYDSDEKMIKTVPENISKGVVKEINGKTVKTINPKNLISFPYQTEATETDEIIYSVNDDRSITITQKKYPLTADFRIELFGHAPDNYYPINPDVFYNLDVFNTESGYNNNNNVFLFVEFYTDPNTARTRTQELYDGVASFKAANNEKYIRIMLKVNKNAVNFGTMTIYPLLNEISFYESSPQNMVYESYFKGFHNAVVDKIKVSGKNYFEGEYTNLYPAQDTGKVTQGTEGKSISIISKVPPNSRILIKKIDAIGDRFRIGTYSEKPILNMVANQYVSNASANEMIIDTGVNDNWILVYLDQTSARKSRMFVGKYSSENNSYSGIGESDIVTVPSEILNLPDYGISTDNTYNYVDFEKKLYYHNVGSVDLGSLTWTYNGINIDKKGFTATVNNLVSVTNSDNIIRLICSDYDSYSGSSMIDKGVIGIAAISNHRFYFSIDTNLLPINGYENEALALKASLANVTVYYELATPEIIDISNIIMPFMLEPGGTVEFVNEYGLDMLNTVIYEKKEMI